MHDGHKTVPIMYKQLSTKLMEEGPIPSTTFYSQTSSLQRLSRESMHMSRTRSWLSCWERTILPFERSKSRKRGRKIARASRPIYQYYSGYRF